MIAYPYAEENLLLIQKIFLIYLVKIVITYILNGQVSGNLTWTIALKNKIIFIIPPLLWIFKKPTAWAPSVFGAVWFCRWVVTHSLRRFQLLWPRSWCLHHTEHPFAFIGRLEQICFGPAYLENVRLNPSTPVLLTRNGPLPIFHTINTFIFYYQCESITKKN
jgi:hypothetical protein